MKNIILSILALASISLFAGCNQGVSTPKVQKVQNKQEQRDIRIISADNTQGKITTKSIEKAFTDNGFEITGNNNMNTAFEKRFNAKKEYEVYRLLFVYSPEASVKLLKDYPKFGLLAPLSTSVYSKDGTTMKISSLSLDGMARISGVPKTNPDLIALADRMTKALKEALPNGEFEDTNYKVTRPDGEIITRFAFVMDNEDDDIEDAKEAYQETMEGEIESNGFIVAGFTSVNEDLEKNNIDTYDFYDTYAICKLEVIYPVHKLHPEVGALAPCTMYMYKKKGEEKTHLAYPSVYNWIMTTDIEDDESLEPLIDAQNLLESTIDSTIE